MKTNRILLIAVVAMTTLSAVLVWWKIVAARRPRGLKAQWEARKTEFTERAARNGNAPRKAVDTTMGKLLAQRVPTAPTPK